MTAEMMESTEARTENETSAEDKEDASTTETDEIETLGKEAGPQEAAQVQKQQRQTPETETANLKT